MVNYDSCVYVFGKNDDSHSYCLCRRFDISIKEKKKLKFIKTAMKSTFKMVDHGQLNNILGIH